MNRRLRLTLCVAAIVLGTLAGGGVAFAGPTEDTTPTSAPASGTVYIVRRGDSLGRIAVRYGISLSALARANGISNPEFVYIGQRLVIPGTSAAGGSATTAPAPTTASGTHVVRRGDTLASIAARYRTTMAALVRANGLANPNVIYIGQRLRISGSGSSSGGSASGGSSGGAPAPALAGRWIDVNVSTQRVTAYEGSRAVFSTAVSTGLPRTPTVLGQFRVYVKYTSTTMTGPGYYLPGVPYTMYFYQGFALHGAYWHHNFGHPMSHGCVNLSIPDSRWLYNFASVGTLVKVHR